MTPKEKAKDILDMFGFIHSYDGLDIMDDELTNEDRKKCALITVNELIHDMYKRYEIVSFKYWNEVKDEIEKL